MATLQIIKNVEGYFRFVLDGNESGSIIDNSPNATSFGDIFHFKTKNGAPIFAKQNILYSEITYTDVADVDFTFLSAHAVWTKLIDEEFFKGLNSTGGSGATRFDDLLDTFAYAGNNGKVPVVNASELKLDPTTFYNYKDFIQLEDVAVSELVVNKMVTTALVLGVPKLVLSDLPVPAEQLVNAMGYLDYNDLGTQTIPLTLVANVDKLLPNDTLGSFTDISQRPFGVSSIIDSSTGAYDFSQLTIGDTIDVRFDITVTTTSANQRVKAFLKLAVGTASEYELHFFDSVFKTAGTYDIVRYFGIYIGAANFRDYPAEFYVNTDSSGTCIVNGWYNRILRKGVNIVDVQSDPLKLDKVSNLTTNPQLYVKDVDGNQIMYNVFGTMPATPIAGEMVDALGIKTYVDASGFTGDTDDVPEGVTNLYFTVARVLASVLTGLSATAGTFTSSNTILEAFGKIKYLIDNIATTYQAILVSGTNIKTINGSSILGSGNISIDTQGYATIASSRSLTDADHNKTIWVTATCNITIPSGLRADFNCVFRVFAGATATFLTSGTTINAQSDTSVVIGKNTCYLAVYTTNNYIISGGV